MRTKLTLLFFVCNYITALAQWQPTNGLFSGEVHSVITSNNEIITGTRYIYKSSDNGRTWFVSNNGITGTVSTIRGIVKISSNLVAITNAGAFYSTDNGNNWTPSAGTSGFNIMAITVKGASLFFSTSGNGVYISTTNGVSWSACNTGITTPFVTMRCLAVRGSDLYAGSDGYGIFKSIDSGQHWTLVNTGLPGSYYTVSSLGVVGTNIFAGTYGAGIYKSTNGTSWGAINNGVSPTDDMLGIGVNGTSVYASTLTGNLYKSTDYTNWNPVAAGPYMTTRYETFYSTGADFYVGCWGMGSTEKSFGVYKTSDDGTTWKHIGITDYPVSCLEASGSNLLAGSYDVSGNSFRVSLFKTTEADTTWAYNLGGINTHDVTALKANGAVMYLFDDEGPGNSLVYRSTNNGLNWTSTGFNVLYNNFNCFAIAGSIIYAGDNSAYYSSSHVFVSSDNGATWNVVNSGIPSSVHQVYGLALKGTLLFVATDNGIYKNTVGANSWTTVNNGLTNMIIKSIYVSDTTLYAGTQGGGIFKSVNDGALWTAASNGLPLFANVTCFTSSGSNLFAGTDNGVFVTASGGTNWSNISTGLIDTTVTVMTATTNYLWAGTNSQGVWRRDLSQIVVSLPSTPGPVSGSTTLCQGSSTTYSVSPVNGATSYTWALPNGWTGSGTTNSIQATAGNSGGTISVTANNSFGSSQAQTLIVSVNAVNTAVIQTGLTLTANAAGAAYVWLNCNGNVPISGGNGQSYTATAVGNYAVVVTQNGCSDTSACFSADTTCHISITGADLPYSGLSVLLSVDTGTQVSLGTPGVSQSWNYSMLTTSYNKFAVYTATSSTAYAAAYPASNIDTYGPAFMFGTLYGGAPVGTADNGYVFWKSDTSGLWVTGFRADAGIAAGINVFDTPHELLIGAPATYGSVFNNSARWELPLNQVPSNIDTFYVRNIRKNIIADACGSLTTPHGVYPDVLRQHENVITVDSIYMKFNGLLVTSLEFSRDTLNNYTYLANGIGYPVCIVHADKHNAVTEAEYFSGTFTGLNNLTDNEPAFRLYPNPAGDIITIDISNSHKSDNQISIYNAIGSLVLQKGTSDTLLNLDVSTFAKGIYFVSVCNGGNSYTKKLVIQ